MSLFWFATRQGGALKTGWPPQPSMQRHNRSQEHHLWQNLPENGYSNLRWLLEASVNVSDWLTLSRGQDIRNSTCEMSTSRSQHDMHVTASTSHCYDPFTFLFAKQIRHIGLITHVRTLASERLYVEDNCRVSFIDANTWAETLGFGYLPLQRRRRDRQNIRFPVASPEG